MEPEDLPIKLDLKDRKILFELDFNSRQTNAELAKKIGLSKQGVDYRIKNLQKNGVITGFYPIIDAMRLGYFYGRIFIKLQNLSSSKEEKIIQEMIKEKKMNWIIKADGNYEILLATWEKSLDSFKQLTRELVSKYSPYIKELKESIGIRVVHYQNRFLLNKVEAKKLLFEETQVRAKIDKIDVKILEILCENARAPLVEMAAKLKISPKVLAYRIKRLETSGVILGYRPSINHKILGFSYYKILFHLMNATKEQFDAFRSFLESNPKVIYIVDEVGICDLDIEAMFESQQDYFDFMKTLKSKFPELIKEYETLIGLETLKVNYLPWDL